MVEPPDVTQGPPLRILLGHDLSEAADLAFGLVRHASWPPSSVVRVISSPMGVGPGISSFANVREARAHARYLREAIASTHERVATELREAGVAAEAQTVPGKPDEAIVAEADRFGADLIVVGARRQGSIAATLLGSVSRAVVERAPCSVLVARSTTARRLLLATDGSPPARYATTIVGTWPMFADAHIVLLGVGEAPPDYPRMVLSDSERRSAYRKTIAASTAEVTATVEEAVDDLSARGRHVEAKIRLGEAATEIVAAAQEWPADMVVQGAHTQPLLERLLLGSVARKVLDGVACSVLIARPAPTADRAISDEAAR